VATKKNDIGVHAIWDNKDFVSGMKAYQAGLKHGTEATKNATKETTAASKETMALGNMWKVAGAAIGVYGAAQLIRGGMELAKLGEQSIRTRKSFEEVARQAGGSSDEILASLTKASQGSIAQTDLMLSANNAMMLGLGANADQLGKLMQVAAFRGQAMGLTTTQAFSDMVRGIGRKSPLILDNLGIVGLKMDETSTKADIMAQVLEQGMSQIAKAGGEAAISVSAFEQFNAQLADFKAIMGELVLPAFTTTMSIAVKGLEAAETALEVLTGIGDIEDPIYKDLIMTIGFEGGTEGQKYKSLSELMQDQVIQAQADMQVPTFDFTTNVDFQQAAEETATLRREFQLLEATGTTLIQSGVRITSVIVKQAREQYELNRHAKEYSLAMNDYRAATTKASKKQQELVRIEQTMNSIMPFVLDNFQEEVDLLDMVESSFGSLPAVIKAAAKATSNHAENMRDSAAAAWEEERALRASQQAHEKYLRTKWLTKWLDQNDYSTAAAQATGAWLPNYADMLRKLLDDIREQDTSDQVKANKASADDFRGKMEGANNIISGDIAEKVRDALGIIDPTRQPGDPDAPAEWWRRLLDISGKGEDAPQGPEMRNDIAQMADFWGVGDMEEILGENSQYRASAKALYEMGAQKGFAGMAALTEKDIGITTIDWEQAGANIVASNAVDAMLKRGDLLAAELLGIPVDFMYANGGTEGENPVISMAKEPILDGTLITSGEEIGALLNSGIQTGLVMKANETPLKPLLDDIDTAITDIKEFKEIWTSLDDKTLTLLIDIEDGGSGGGGGGGESGVEWTGGDISEEPWEGGHFAGGANFIVPPGYARDAYPMRVSSGERVIVQTPAQQIAGAGRTVSMGPIYINNGMDLAEFNANVRRVVGGDLE